MALVDMDRDGVKDIVTGKRYWAHNGHDPGAYDPAVSYWFQTVRKAGKVHFVPHRIDLNSGVGTQVSVGDLNGDQWPDLIVGNKKGTFALIHHAKEVDKDAWLHAQPKPTKSIEETPADDSVGILPVGANGKPLNLDFEKGSTDDWAASGEAFSGQPIRGDTVHPRRSDSESKHQGEYWIGGYEKLGDSAIGTLTSAPFRVTHRWASFLVGGGQHSDTRVEIIRKQTEKPIFQASGNNRENMELHVLDLQQYMGEDIFVRLVDQNRGGWGHVNFDSFRFHDENPSPEAPLLAAQGFLHTGLSPADAAAAMTVPAGFSVQVFAAEPDVKQPIAMAIDDRGRIWVAEAYEYPRRAPEGEGTDRILIFEDTDLDGHFDKRTVFAEGLNLISGLEVGFGGVWVGASPYFMFIPDRDGDDVPDSKPQILLDGWHYEDTHETLNAFIWGPDGWLYGCHGVFTHSVVGKPGTPEDERIPFNAGVWRYHPTLHKFEAFAQGSSNPWGVDFNDRGQAFITACVIPHLYHMIQGGRYQRQGGQHFNRYTYDDIKTIADHLHYAGNIADHAWWGRDEPAVHASTDAAGGGHAHAGAMIYLGGSWPTRYHDQIFMNNIHGARLNQDILTPRGSGYVGQHGHDFLFAHDQASQIINLRYGPDGQVYFIDWYDMQQCHRSDPSAHDRTNGRIFRLAYNNAPSVKVDLKQLSDTELVELQLNENDWYVRHARRILQERASTAKLQPAAVKRLVEIVTTHQDETRRLRALWVLHVTRNLPIELVIQLASDKSPYVRGWVVQAVMEQSGDAPSPELMLGLASMALGDPSPIVRLYLASASQKFPINSRWEIMQALLSHADDANDHNLPLMYWYAFEPLVQDDMELALELAQAGKIPVVFRHTIRRIAEIGSEEAISLLVNALAASSDDSQQAIFLNTMSEAFRGSRSLPMPKNWPELYGKLAQSKNDSIRTQARRLAVKFGDLRALAETRTILSDAAVNLDQRKSALASLLGAKDPELAPILQTLIADRGLRREALRGLAAYSDAKTPSIVLAAYRSFTTDERRDALSTLSSRPQYALPLLDAIIAKQIAASDLSADLIRQLGNLGDEAIKHRVAEIWGVVRETAADKKKLAEKYQKIVRDEGPKPDLHLGRALFTKSCQQCHKLFAVGHSIGPELTGSNRANLDYLLSNVVDPSAVMAKEYQPLVIVTDSGRTITGLVQAEDDRSLTIATATETIILPRDEIEESSLSQTSMMPDNQWQQLSPHEIRSLVAYLASPKQVPILATPDNASSFFNGQDLAGWSGNMKLWKVEDGQIVGTSPGIEKNTFLVSDFTVEDFELTLQVRLTPNTGNSGIQFRSEALPGGNVKGYQADIGAGWWGKLYEEHGRAILWDKPAQQHVLAGQWNEYRIVAQGSKIKTYLNGNLCVDLDDPNGASRGIIALQIHAGPAMEIRFKDFQLTVTGSGEK